MHGIGSIATREYTKYAMLDYIRKAALYAVLDDAINDGVYPLVSASLVLTQAILSRINSKN